MTNKNEVKIVEVFGQFAVELTDGPEMFSTEAEAKAALAQYENGAEHARLADGYCAYKGLTAKNAKGKANVIADFLAWVDAGTPEPTEVPAEEATEEVATEEQF